MSPLEAIKNTTDAADQLARWAADISVKGLAAQPDDVVLSTMVGVEEISRLLDAVKVQLAAVVEERSEYGGVAEGLAAEYGHSRGVHLIEHVTHISQSEAQRRVRLGKYIRSEISLTGEVIPPQYTEVARAVETGEISVHIAERIIQGLEQARRFHVSSEFEQPGEFEENLAAAETALVEQATREPADAVAIQVMAWRDALDPDGAPLRDEDVRARRGLRRGKERNGVTRFTWDTTGETTAMVDGILEEARAATTPRFMPTEQYNELEGVGITLAGPDQTAELLGGQVDCTEYGVVLDTNDTRTPAQRDSDVLDGFVRAGIRATANEMGGIKPIVEVTAVATLADLEAGRGVGWINGIDEPVSIGYIKELACGSGYRLLIQGDKGEVLWMGNKPRLFSDAQKRAVVVRDGARCAAAGCNKPARQCDVHHVEFHSKGGPTDVDNAILFCSEHHHMIHKSPFTIEMRNGRPFILAPRWLNPRQTWRPMGHPRHRMPRVKNPLE